MVKHSPAILPLSPLKRFVPEPMIRKQPFALLRCPTGMKQCCVVVAIAIVVSSCAHDLNVRYPDEGSPVGKLAVLLSEPASVTIVVNGVLLVQDQRTERVDIDNVPIGAAEVTVAAAGGEKQVHAFVTSEHVTTLPIGAPPANSGLLSTLLSTVVSVTMYVLIRRI
jgi:hypothetical protein